MKESPHKLTLEDGKKALTDHVIEKATEVQDKYGLAIDFEILTKIFSDPTVLRFPTTIVFDSSKVEAGLFATTEPYQEDGVNKVRLYIHEYFADKPESLSLLALYHVVAINYGDFASAEDAEIFASTVLCMDRELYYQKLCKLVDQIPGNKAEDFLDRVTLEDQIMMGAIAMAAEAENSGHCGGSGSCGCKGN